MYKINRFRQNLSVEVRFSEDGQLTPLRILAEDQVFDVTKISNCRKHAPQGVASVAPVEYTVIVDGVIKRLYYEPDSNVWFSVRTSFSE